MSNFWQKLPKPFFVLAPMANVTDVVFRKLFASFGAPDVTWTEFVSADGLLSAGRDKLLIDLEYSRTERPVVAQLFTGHADVMQKAAALVAELGFDGLDINMGCPDRAVEKQGGGAANIRNPENAVAVLNAAKAGVLESFQNGKAKKVIPVSVKTRLGYNKVDFNWLRVILEQKPPVLTVHLRTRKEMSAVPAHWELMPEVVKLRNEVSPETLIIGNGDVMTLVEARQKCFETGCDGVMIGRGIFGKPWFFAGIYDEEGNRKPAGDISDTEKNPTERLEVMVKHARAFEKKFKGIKSFDLMKKHFKAYVNGWDGAKELRVELMACRQAREVGAVVRRYLKKDKK